MTLTSEEKQTRRHAPGLSHTLIVVIVRFIKNETCKIVPHRR